MKINKIKKTLIYNPTLQELADLHNCTRQNINQNVISKIPKSEITKIKAKRMSKIKAILDK